MKKTSHWIYYPALLSLVVPLAAACGFGATEPAPSTNQGPIGEGSLPWEMLTLGDFFVTSVSPYFIDPDDEFLDYTARSRNPGVVAATMKGGTLILSAVGQGVAEIAVTARDPEGLSASRHLVVTVAAAAVASHAVSTGDPGAERPR